MEKNDVRYNGYVQVLKNHLHPAMGCTEPIAIAYCASLARAALGKLPDKVTALVSGNIIKNAKAVTVPHTGGKKGIEAACAAGVVAGDEKKELQVLSGINQEEILSIDEYLARGVITVGMKPDARLFDIYIRVEADGHIASARICDRHTNVVEITCDDKVLFKKDFDCADTSCDENEKLLTIEGIYDFASTCDIDDVKEIIDKQILLNTAIAEEGIKGNWGAAVGKTIIDSYGDSDVRIRAKAMAAAGSDARMSGCELPVVINSGSGNQGITVSLPVIEYAKEMNVGHEKLCRALVLSNLVAIHQKTLIGCLSAYCGAISAGCAAGAGIAYLCGGDLYIVNHTIVNSLAILSGTICDGAKPSCAAKIASAIDAALLGYQMALNGRQFRSGEGIITKGVENTINNVGRLGKEGMRETDQEILKIMTGC